MITCTEIQIKNIFYFTLDKKNALAGNRTRAARVAGEHSTTEPPVLRIFKDLIAAYLQAAHKFNELSPLHIMNTT
jgi:hypothetical protein